jgi:hypothetical protein
VCAYGKMASFTTRLWYVLLLSNAASPALLQDPARAVTVDTDVLEFGTCSRLSTSEYQAVQVRGPCVADLCHHSTAVHAARSNRKLW